MVFSGIVQECRTFYVNSDDGGVELALQKDGILKDCKVGDSVAVNGVCLTVAREEYSKLFFFVQQETLACTTFRWLTGPQKTLSEFYAHVNVELPSSMQDACHGHVVLGHVHTVALIKEIHVNCDACSTDLSGGQGSWEVTLELPYFDEDRFRRLYYKASVTVHGVSLTISDLQLDETHTVIRVSVIPITQQKTSFRYAKPGEWVNVEFVNHETTPTLNISEIPEVVEDLRRGKMVIVMDNEDRENEGDIIVAAKHCTAEHMALMIRHTSGILCAPMTQRRAEELDLPLMIKSQGWTPDPLRTSFTVSCDACDTTTGVSAEDRASTFHALADAKTTPPRLQRPGHIFPLVARDGLLAEREGHTEAAVTLMKLARMDPPVAAIGELTNDDGTMMRLWNAVEFAKKHNIRVTTIDKMKAHLGITRSPKLDEVQVLSSSEIFLKNRGLWTIHVVYCNRPSILKQNFLTNQRVVLVKNIPTDDFVNVRIHSACFTGDVLGSCLCDCGEQLEQSIAYIAARDNGLIIYEPEHEGRGIGLVEKVRAYRLLRSDESLDTYSANVQLGHQEDERLFDGSADILRFFKIERVGLLTSNPLKVESLAARGFRVQMQNAPVSVASSPHNEKYLESKRSRGHVIVDK